MCAGGASSLISWMRVSSIWFFAVADILCTNTISVKVDSTLRPGLGANAVFRSASSAFRTQGVLRAEDLDDSVVSLDIRPADQVDAVRNRGEDADMHDLAVSVAQALERLADGARLARQVHDQTGATHHRHLTR